MMILATQFKHYTVYFGLIIQLQLVAEAFQSCDLFTNVSWKQTIIIAVEKVVCRDSFFCLKSIFLLEIDC